MDGFLERHAFLTQLIDGIQFQDRVIDHDTAGDDKPDGGHQVQRMPANPQQQQSERHIYGNLRKHQQGLQEALELGGKDEIHQQQGNQQDHHQFVQHLTAGEEAAGKARIPLAGGFRYPLHLPYQLVRILHPVEVEGHKLPVTARNDTFQVFGRRHLYQFTERNVFHPALAVRLRPHQRFPQNSLHRLLIPRNHYRKILLVGMQHRHAVFAESGFQYPVHLIVGDTVEQQFLLVDAQVQLVLESRSRGADARFPCQFPFHLADRLRLRRLCPVAGIEFGNDVRLARHKKFLEHRFRRRERNHAQRIAFLQLPVYLLLQGGDPCGSLRTEIKLRFRRGKFPFAVQDKILPADRSRLFQRPAVQFLEKHLHTLPVFIHMDILVPFDAGHQFVLLDIRHPLLADKEKEEEAKRKGDKAEEHAQPLMAEHPADARIVETVQRMVLYRIIEPERQPLPFPCPHTRAVNQQVEHGKEHDARKVGHHQPHRHRESLVEEHGPADAAQKDERGENGDGSQRGAKHGGRHLVRARHAGTPQGISPFTVLRDILRHDNRTVDHHAQGKDQSRQGDDIQGHAEEVEEHETDDDGNHHADTDNQRGLHIPQEKHRHKADEHEAQREVLPQVGNRIVQQFRLVAADGEINVRVDMPEILHCPHKRVLHVIHILVRLLDDGKAHRPFAVREGHPLLLHRHDADTAEVLQLHDAVALAQVYILHVLSRAQQRGEFYIVLIVSVTHRHAARLHVIGGESRLDVLDGQPHHRQFAGIGHNLNLPFQQARHVHHSHFRQLLDATFDHGLGKLAQVKERLLPHALRSAVVLQRQVQVEHGDVRRAGLHHFRAFRLFGEVAHRRVYLLVHLDEGEVRIRAVLKGKADNARPVPRFAADILQHGDLHQLAPQRPHHRIFQLARRSVGGGYLHRDLRNGDIRKQRHGQRGIRHQPDDKAGGESHQYGNGAPDQKSNHTLPSLTNHLSLITLPLTTTSPSCARFRLPVTITVSPSSRPSSTPFSDLSETMHSIAFSSPVCT